MPRLTRWFIKSGLLYLLAGLLLAVLMQWPGIGTVPWLRAVWSTYLHLLVVGWLTQLIFGVAFWLFPRYSAERPRGSEPLGWATFLLLNVGVTAAAAGGITALDALSLAVVAPRGSPPSPSPPMPGPG